MSQSRRPNDNKSSSMPPTTPSSASGADVLRSAEKLLLLSSAKTKTKSSLLLQVDTKHHQRSSSSSSNSLFQQSSGKIQASLSPTTSSDVSSDHHHHHNVHVPAASSTISPRTSLLPLRNHGNTTASGRSSTGRMTLSSASASSSASSSSSTAVKSSRPITSPSMAQLRARKILEVQKARTAHRRNNNTVANKPTLNNFPLSPSSDVNSDWDDDDDEDEDDSSDTSSNNVDSETLSHVSQFIDSLQVKVHQQQQRQQTTTHQIQIQQLVVKSPRSKTRYQSSLANARNAMAASPIVSKKGGGAEPTAPPRGGTPSGGAASGTPRGAREASDSLANARRVIAASPRASKKGGIMAAGSPGIKSFAASPKSKSFASRMVSASTSTPPRSSSSNSLQTKADVDTTPATPTSKPPKAKPDETTNNNNNNNAPSAKPPPSSPDCKKDVHYYAILAKIQKVVHENANTSLGKILADANKRGMSLDIVTEIYKQERFKASLKHDKGGADKGGDGDAGDAGGSGAGSGEVTAEGGGTPTEADEVTNSDDPTEGKEPTSMDEAAPPKQDVKMPSSKGNNRMKKKEALKKSNDAKGTDGEAVSENKASISKGMSEDVSKILSRLNLKVSKTDDTVMEDASANTASEYNSVTPSPGTATSKPASDATPETNPDVEPTISGEIAELSRLCDQATALYNENSLGSSMNSGSHHHHQEEETLFPHPPGEKPPMMMSSVKERKFEVEDSPKKMKTKEKTKIGGEAEKIRWDGTRVVVEDSPKKAKTNEGEKVRWDGTRVVVEDSPKKVKTNEKSHPSPQGRRGSGGSGGTPRSKTTKEEAKVSAGEGDTALDKYRTKLKNKEVAASSSTKKGGDATDAREEVNAMVTASSPVVKQIIGADATVAAETILAARKKPAAVDASISSAIPTFLSQSAPIGIACEMPPESSPTNSTATWLKEAIQDNVASGESPVVPSVDNRIAPITVASPETVPASVPESSPTNSAATWLKEAVQNIVDSVGSPAVASVNGRVAPAVATETSPTNSAATSPTNSAATWETGTYTALTGITMALAVGRGERLPTTHGLATIGSGDSDVFDNVFSADDDESNLNPEGYMHSVPSIDDTYINDKVQRQIGGNLVKESEVDYGIEGLSAKQLRQLDQFVQKSEELGGAGDTDNSSQVRGNVPVDADNDSVIDAFFSRFSLQDGESQTPKHLEGNSQSSSAEGAGVDAGSREKRVKFEFGSPKKEENVLQPEVDGHVGKSVSKENVANSVRFEESSVGADGEYPGDEEASGERKKTKPKHQKGEEIKKLPEHLGLWKSPWQRHQIAGSNSLDVASRESAAGIDAAGTFSRQGGGGKHSQRSIPLNKRKTGHHGYKNIDFYSLYEATEVEAKDEDIDQAPWEYRDVGQRFLHEKSVESRNWFGSIEIKRVNDRIPTSVCRPKSLKMALSKIAAPGDWSEDWYTTWKSRKDNPNNLISFAQDETLKTEGNQTGSDSTNFYSDSSSTKKYVVEIGSFCPVRVRNGERISRVHFAFTSSLRQSRWRKKYLKGSLFPAH